jgi:hypothetical protein
MTNKVPSMTTLVLRSLAALCLIFLGSASIAQGQGNDDVVQSVLRALQLSGDQGQVLSPTSASEANTSPVRTNEEAVDLVIEHYQQGCNSALEEYRDIDADLDEPVIGELIIDEENIYEIDLTPDGSTKGTVIYNDFGCIGDDLPVYPWCGTGGCGFEIVVNGVIYERSLGGRPFSVTAKSPFRYSEDDLTVVLTSIHGTGCDDAVGHSGAGYQTCLVSAWWDPDFNTFRSKGGDIRLSGLNQ